MARTTHAPATPTVIDIDAYMLGLGRNARAAARTIAAAGTGAKSRGLQAIAAALNDARAALAEANELDLAGAKSAKIEQPLIDRLVLDERGIDRMIDGIREVDALPDPIGAITDLEFRPSGIQVGRMRVPLGVIGMIYESRPNVTADAAALCLKSGNACILRGGSEAFHTNSAIAAAIAKGLVEAQLPVTAVQLVATTDRAAVGALLKLKQYIDVLIPRGGRSLIERVSAESAIPVIKHLDGICHVYIDDGADPDMAVQIAFNSKTEKYAVCNAMETLLVAQSIAPRVLPSLRHQFERAGVELRGCAKTRVLLPGIAAAAESDWHAEYLAPILSIRIVAGLDEAIDHIATYGSQHTDVIVSNDYARARRFVTEVDSASVMVNVSTQFADGFEFGLGAEIGISTDKLHARGPVGLEGLTTQKFVVFGNGEIRHR
ncbi:MAG TPA: glutamate-5-semialdehyde dehydrogenase [Pseudomonadales bacterium]|nr:glutamate-5-semialdehyde dehydrogenase [Pseudomonadales bacterium]